MNARLFSLFAFVSILATGAWAAPASTPASSDAPTQLFSRNDSSAQIALANEFETLFVSLNASLMGTIVELVDYDTQTSVMMLKQNMTVTSLNSSLSDMGTSIEEHVNATSALESSAGQYDAYDMLDVHPNMKAKASETL